jgi:type I restriction enzyme M protein
MAKTGTGTKKPGRPKASEPAPPPSSPPSAAATSGAMLGFEAKLWQAADKLRNNMDAAERFMASSP